ncbi:uncharacterized protein EDB91DRAFT_1254901 [Suillus paluster]|uniref:uncharacterized protein n=1 Tax=Suillus paluster TaxID=48578 RepID=UPI001B8755ED|nr:uncharacterized protein EDB91DRAFT_1254901 [Suillus paluster]KAG1725163.1 hypothetical protein EDB91DRAFT_1254901 [Suillus paluster]
MIKHFAKEMFTQAGMRLFVLGSWKDEQGSLLTSGQVHAFIRSVGRSVIMFTWFGRFDFNEQLGKGSSFMKCKDWQVILPAWEDFIGDVFDQDQDQDGILLGGTRQGSKPYYEFDLDRMGLPILPDIDGFSLNTKKGVIQDNQVGPTFQFKAWIDDKGKMHPPVGKESDDSDGDADNEAVQPMLTKKSRTTVALSLPGHPKGRPRSIKRAYISSADEESSDADAELSDQVGCQSESDDRPPRMSL